MAYLSFGRGGFSLILEKELDTLDGSGKGLGDGGGNTSDHEGLDGREKRIELALAGGKDLLLLAFNSGHFFRSREDWLKERKRESLLS